MIYQTDHGELLGDHGIYLKGPHFYEPSVRIPFVVRWPGHYKAGLRSGALVEMVDLVATLLEACGIPIPPGVQGKSLTAILTGQSNVHRDSIYCEHCDSSLLYEPPPMATMVRSERYKLIVYHSLNFQELYDLQNDPHKFTNIWNAPGSQGARQAMLIALTNRMAETVDPLPIRTVPC